MNYLRMPSMSITDVADALGYSDRYTFSKQFKKITSLSPSEYRRRIFVQNHEV